MYLEGVLNCELWSNEDVTLKVEILSALILGYIRNQCSCEFPSTNINQTTFTCYDNVMNVVAVSVQVSEYITFNVSNLIEIFHNWADTFSSVVIQGQSLIVNSDCSIVVSDSDNFECLPATELIKLPSSTLSLTTISASVSLLWVVVGVPLTVLIILTMMIIIAVVLSIAACKKIKS